ncbi:MAG: endonuclease domain-containing protein [Bacteroidetes bacterium]|nr:endonuclease domain-containing protein [Bacteroidota bacterium]
MAKLSGGEIYPIYFGAKPELLRIAADLRHSLTRSERLLWNKVRNRQLLGFKFHRQHPMNEFILDFYCNDARLSIEIDGNVHNDPYQKERDRERTRILNHFGIHELRFSNREVETQIEQVINRIIEYLESCTLPPKGGRAGDGGSMPPEGRRAGDGGSIPGRGKGWR